MTDEPRHRVDLLHRNIQRHGTIFDTLAEVCEVSGTIKALPSRKGPERGPGQTLVGLAWLLGWWSGPASIR